jgi:hypothetical protein
LQQQERDEAFAERLHTTQSIYTDRPRRSHPGGHGAGAEDAREADDVAANTRKYVASLAEDSPPASQCAPAPSAAASYLIGGSASHAASQRPGVPAGGPSPNKARQSRGLNDTITLQELRVAIAKITQPTELQARTELKGNSSGTLATPASTRCSRFITSFIHSSFAPKAGQKTWPGRSTKLATYVTQGTIGSLL